MENCRAYYFDDDASVLPRSIATRQAMLNAMTLDIAMGGSTNTVLHLLAVANEAGVDFTMNDIDVLSRKTPVLCKVAPNSKYHIEDVNRAGGIPSILPTTALSTHRADALTDLHSARKSRNTQSEERHSEQMPKRCGRARRAASEPPSSAAKAPPIPRSTTTAPTDVSEISPTPT